MDNPTAKVTPSGGENKRAISKTPCTNRLFRLPALEINSKEVSLAVRNNEHPISFQCQKITAPNIRGSQDTIITGHIDPDLIEKINREIQATGIPDHNKPFRRQHHEDILEPTWEAYLSKQQSSQGLYLCHGDAGLIYSSEIPMPGEEKDRQILPAAQPSITELVDTIHKLNPDIEKYFGQNALRLATLNYYFHHPTESGMQSLTDFCLGWHVDKTKVGQLVACINLRGQRTLAIRHSGKLTTEIESKEPGHFYLFDGTQFEHAVRLSSTEDSLTLVLRSPFVPKGTDIRSFFNNTDICLPPL